MQVLFPEWRQNVGIGDIKNSNLIKFAGFSYAKKICLKKCVHVKSVLAFKVMQRLANSSEKQNENITVGGHEGGASRHW